MLINVGLTLLGYIPGHVHAFYILYVFYSRADAAHGGPHNGVYERAPGIYSERVQTGGRKLTHAPAPVGPPQGHYAPEGQQYGTMA